MQSNQAAESGKRTSLHGHWSSRLAFVLAVTGSAVGLGNVWKFPYVAGQNGGGAFVIVYLLCVFLIGMPVMMSEILIGRRGRRNPVATMALLGEEEGSSRRWAMIGGMGTIVGPLIGAIVLSLLNEYLRVIEEYRIVVYSGLLILFIYLAPEGFANLSFVKKSRVLSSFILGERRVK